MKTIRFLTVAVLAVLSPAVAAAQGGGYGRGGMTESGLGRRGEGSAPKLPGPELDGPPDSATISPVLGFTADQAARYVAARDSFMAATKVERDSARALETLMYQKLDAGDRAAALFYAEPLQDLGKDLKKQQDAFEDRVRKGLSGEQARAYDAWRKAQDKAAEEQAKQDALRWQVLPFGGGRPALEAKTFVSEPALPQPDAGSQAVRIGRSVYVASQLAVDAAGKIVGADLHAQAVRAFANLTRVLAAAQALPEDVVRLTIYVVSYQPDDLAAVREAGAAYFAARNPPVITVLGVQALSREGALIAVEATAVQGTSRMPETTTK